MRSAGSHGTLATTCVPLRPTAWCSSGSCPFENLVLARAMRKTVQTNRMLCTHGEHDEHDERNEHNEHDVGAQGRTDLHPAPGLLHPVSRALSPLSLAL